MTCLAGLLPAPVSGQNRVEVEGISYGEASCSAEGSLRAGRLHRTGVAFSPGPPPLQFPRCSPRPMPFEISSFAWAGLPKPSRRSLTKPCVIVCVRSHVSLARGIMRAGSGFTAL